MEIGRILKEKFGFEKFRPAQEKIVNHLCNRSHVFAVLPTGAGKSLCYQIPPLALGERAIIVSPLIALMDDQVASLQDRGIQADRIHTGRSYEQCANAWRQFRDHPPGLLYMSPEKLMTPKVIAALQKIPVGFFIIDEAHCISKWGASFRPEYAALSELKNIFPKATIGAFTATADSETQQDIVEKLTNGTAIRFVQGFDRPNLKLAVEEKVSWKSQLLGFLEDKRNCSGIVYCLSRKQTEAVADFLNNEGFTALPYHAGLETKARRDKQDQFMTDSAVIMVATIAFGMGIDKPDIRFVAHVSLPGSMESYYQEIGRAGRDEKPADTMLLFSLSDLFQRRRFIEEGDDDDSHKVREHKRLDSLIAYCEAPTCRRHALLHYFGEKSKSCGNCDNCLNPPTLIDGTELAIQILATIKATGQFFGASHIIDVLRGALTEKVSAKEHDRLDLFGATAALSKIYLQGFIRQLVSAGHVTLNIKKYGGLEVSDSGFKILQRTLNFSFKDIPTYAHTNQSSSNVKKSIPDHSYVDEDADLFSRLKQKRLELARQKNVPAFVVFSDTVLHEMVAKKPKDRNQFSTLFGVGTAKLDRYGDIFLAVINDTD
jgi:ATP-dependent DNA helicase RecQ